MPSEPAWRISKDFKIKRVVGRSRGQAESTSAAPGSLLHKWLNADGMKVRQRREKPGHLLKATEEQSDQERSVLQSSKAQHRSSGFALAVKGTQPSPC